MIHPIVFVLVLSIEIQFNLFDHSIKFINILLLNFGILDLRIILDILYSWSRSLSFSISHVLILIYLMSFS